MSSDNVSTDDGVTFSALQLINPSLNHRYTRGDIVRFRGGSLPSSSIADDGLTVFRVLPLGRRVHRTVETLRRNSPRTG